MEREQGDKVEYFLMDLDHWQRRREPGRCKNTGTEGRPRVASGHCCLPSSLVPHTVTASYMFWVLESLFQRRCGVPLVSCCGSGNLSRQRRCGVSCASCCGSGSLLPQRCCGVPDAVCCGNSNPSLRRPFFSSMLTFFDLARSLSQVTTRKRTSRTTSQIFVHPKGKRRVLPSRK